MRVTEVRAVPVRVPLKTPYVFARGQMTDFENVIVRVETDEGITGYGESAPSFGIAPMGASTLARSIEAELGSDLLGMDPFDIELIIGRALEATDCNLDGLASVDAALWDILGKYLGQPVYRLLGGLCQNPIAVDYTISSADPADMVAKAREVHEKGYQGVVVKVTGESVELGIEQTLQVRGALPASSTVRVDVNGGFERDEALEFLTGIANRNIELVEQPVAAKDLEGLRQCREVGIPISVDESLTTLSDAIALVRSEACDIMNIKPPKVGGLLVAKRMAAIAEAAGVPIVVGGKTTLEISRAVSRHFAAATCSARGRAHEGPGPASQALSDDVVANRTTVDNAAKEGGFVYVEQEPGIGIKVLWNKVLEYALPVAI